MTAPSKNIALLLFLRNEVQEAAAKPLAAKGRRVDRVIYRQLNQYTRRQAQSSGLPLLVVKGNRQSGGTFGERLANAFEYAFSRGYEQVIAIGNDCLALDAARLKNAARLLEQSGLALGPAKDGGVYLLGLSRRAYNRQLFLGLPWQTDRLFSAFGQYAQRVRFSVLLLPMEEDADDAYSFQRLLACLPSKSKLRQALVKLLSLAIPPLYALLFPLSDQQQHTIPKRGPPLC